MKWFNEGLLKFKVRIAVASQSTEAAPAKREKKFAIYRWVYTILHLYADSNFFLLLLTYNKKDPEQPGQKPYLKEYTIDLNK